jgi:hypothetical protein
MLATVTFGIIRILSFGDVTRIADENDAELCRSRGGAARARRGLLQRHEEVTFLGRTMQPRHSLAKREKCYMDIGAGIVYLDSARFLRRPLVIVYVTRPFA